MSKLRTRPVPARTPKKNECDVASLLHSRHPTRTARATARTAMRPAAVLTTNMSIPPALSRRSLTYAEYHVRAHSSTWLCLTAERRRGGTQRRRDAAGSYPSSPGTRLRARSPRRTSGRDDEVDEHPDKSEHDDPGERHVNHHAVAHHAMHGSARPAGAHHLTAHHGAHASQAYQRAHRPNHCERTQDPQ